MISLHAKRDQPTDEPPAAPALMGETHEDN
jgi:hypothetical protein